jgi:hypothetical protein
MWKKKDKFRFLRLKVTFNKWLFTTESHRFTSIEIGIAEVVLRAYRDRMVVSVCVEQGRRGRIIGIVLRCAESDRQSC